jgi:chitinase
MDRLISSRFSSVRVAAILAVMLVMGSAGAVAAKRPPSPTPPPPPPSTSPTINVAIAPSGTLEPNMEYATVDVTVTCTEGWTWSYGYLNVLQGDRGGGGTFTVPCTGTAQVARSRVVNGNRFTLGNWTASAHVGISRNGQQVTATSTRSIRLEPGVTAQVANQGQLTGTSGGGVRLAVAVACPIGATGQESYVTVSQNGTALARAFFTPTCDRQTHTLVLSLPASQGTFHTGSAVGDASVTVTWNGEAFFGVDNRAITLLESSTGDTTPPTTPASLSAMTFGDTETWLSWGASTDNATPTGLIVYEVYLNGTFDQAIGGGYTQAILYVEANRLNTIEVFAVDGAGNRSAPATTTVDLRQ